MKILVPALVQDPSVAQYKDFALFETARLEDEFFLDGPISPRVAVLDFDETGALRPGVVFVPPAAENAEGGYAADPAAGPHNRAINAVTAFTTVLQTMTLFEGENALGRRVRWAFDAPQLFVVPRAGADANAYYERESHSVQFFSFPSKRSGATIHTSLSRDVVAHETGHAVLDAIAPDLYHASTPQSLALHEAIADLTAILSGFESDELRKTVLAQSKGRIDVPCAFNWIAEEFGRERDPERGEPLRSLLNNKKLATSGPNAVDSSEPHDLSEVLSGALYRMMIAIYERLRRMNIAPEEALENAATQFRRVTYRALDYLPPGEVSFADYARALIAADQVSHPHRSAAREILVREFLRRKIIRRTRDLAVRTNEPFEPLESVDLGTLCASDWAAYAFANRHRSYLGIPRKIHFRVLPRLDSTKTYFYSGGRKERVRECIFKVSWDAIETNPLGARYPTRRQITVGTTLAIDWETRRVRARLRSAYLEQKEARDMFLRRLAADGILVTGDAAKGVDGKPIRSVIRAESLDGLMRLRASGRYLHIGRS